MVETVGVERFGAREGAPRAVFDHVHVLPPVRASARVVHDRAVRVHGRGHGRARGVVREESVRHVDHPVLPPVAVQRKGQRIGRDPVEHVRPGHGVELGVRSDPHEEGAGPEGHVAADLDRAQALEVHPAHVPRGHVPRQERLLCQERPVPGERVPLVVARDVVEPFPVAEPVGLPVRAHHFAGHKGLGVRGQESGVVRLDPRVWGARVRVCARVTGQGSGVSDRHARVLVHGLSDVRGR